MYKLCKSEQSANRQRRLEQGLLEAMAVSHYEQITISDLCQKMGIPRKSFYRYFSGKDGALHALIDHTLMQYETQTTHDIMNGRFSAHRELEQLFVFWQEQKILLDALNKSGLSGVLIERAIEHTLAEAGYHRGVESGRVLSEEENVIMFAICGLMSMIVQWHHLGYSTPAAQMAETAERILTRPLFKQM